MSSSNTNINTKNTNKQQQQPQARRLPTTPLSKTRPTHATTTSNTTTSNTPTLKQQQQQVKKPISSNYQQHQYNKKPTTTTSSSSSSTTTTTKIKEQNHHQQQSQQQQSFESNITHDDHANNEEDHHLIINVTRHNFEQILPQLTTEIQKCRFISVDCEFSGLDVDKSLQVNRYDRLEQRYMKICCSAKQFEVVQFGLCLWFFSGDEEESEKLLSEKNWSRRNSRAREEYGCKVYNFYLMRQSQRNDVAFLCQPHCLSFLVSHGMDFNRVFSDGISYMNGWEEAQIVERQNLQVRQKMKNQISSASSSGGGGGDKEQQVIGDQEREMIQRVRNQILEWFTHNPHGKCLNLPPFDARVRRLIMEQLLDEMTCRKLAFKVVRDKVTFETFIRVLRLDHFANQNPNSKQTRELNGALGFRRVIKLILDRMRAHGSDHKKQCTLLGHNMFLDLAHIMHKFVCPLPDSIEEFRRLVHEHFPSVIDTKYLVLQDEYLSKYVFHRSTTLEHLFDGARYQLRPSTNELFFCDHEYFFGVLLGRKRTSHGQLHSAGWDAFMTGYSFVQISAHIAQRSASQTPSLLSTPLCDDSTDKNNSGDAVDPIGVTNNSDDKTTNGSENGESNGNGDEAHDDDDMGAKPVTELISGLTHLRPYLNVVHMMRSDVNFDLTKPVNAGTESNRTDGISETVQDRSLVLYVSNLDPATGTEQVDKLFKPFCEKLKTSWIDETSAFVELDSLDTVKRCIENYMPSSELGTVSVMTYDDADRKGVFTKQISRYSLPGSSSTSTVVPDTDSATTASRKRTRQEMESEFDGASAHEEQSRPKKKANTCLIM